MLEIPGALVYGQSQQEAIAKVKALALRAISRLGAERLAISHFGRIPGLKIVPEPAP